MTLAALEARGGRSRSRAGGRASRPDGDRQRRLSQGDRRGGPSRGRGRDLHPRHHARPARDRLRLRPGRLVRCRRCYGSPLRREARRRHGRRYLAEGGYYWNSGIFVLRASDWSSALERFRPDILEAVRAVVGGTYAGCPVHSSGQAGVHRRARGIRRLCRHGALPWQRHRSAHRAARRRLERSRRVGRGLAGRQEGRRGQLGRRRRLPPRASNSHVHATGRLVASSVSTTWSSSRPPTPCSSPHRDRSQDVKKIVTALGEGKRGEHALHRKVHRPWGWYDSIDHGGRFQVKRIMVKPGASLSLQMHHHRAEHWIVVSGTAEVTNGDKVILLTREPEHLHPARREASPREPRQGAAGDHRSAVGLLPRRGRHRPLRGHLREKLSLPALMQRLRLVALAMAAAPGRLHPDPERRPERQQDRRVRRPARTRRRGDPDGDGRRCRRPAPARAAQATPVLGGPRRRRPAERHDRRPGRRDRGEHLGSAAGDAVLERRLGGPARRHLGIACRHAAGAGDRPRRLRQRSVRRQDRRRGALAARHRAGGRAPPEGQGQPARGPGAAGAQCLGDRHGGRRGRQQREGSPHAERRAPPRRAGRRRRRSPAGQQDDGADHPRQRLLLDAAADRDPRPAAERLAAGRRRGDGDRPVTELHRPRLDDHATKRSTSRPRASAWRRRWPGRAASTTTAPTRAASSSSASSRWTRSTGRASLRPPRPRAWFR